LLGGALGLGGGGGGLNALGTSLSTTSMKRILLTLKDNSFRAEKTQIFLVLVGGNHLLAYTVLQATRLQRTVSQNCTSKVDSHACKDTGLLHKQL